MVVGGGVIGLATAWRLARRGARVRVLDPEPGRGAAWVAAGMLAPVTEAAYGEEALTRVLLAAAAAWPAFAAELTAASGTDPHYRRCGTLVVAANASDRAALDELVGFQASLGLTVARRSSSECRALVPALAPAIRGGAEVPDDHQVDNRRLLVALLAAVEGAGVALHPARVRAVARSGGRAVGCVLEDGSQVGADAVVVAAGTGVGALEGLPPGTLPAVRPVQGHILRLAGDPGAPLLARTVRALVQGRSVYLVPRHDGSVVLGATVEERGFDHRVRAGPVFSLLEDARRVVPGVDELELRECAVGLRPGSPDNAPTVGWTAVAGLAVAAGQYRNGILQAPLVAESLAALVAGGDLPGVLAPFAPGAVRA